ncbi:MAG TPA: DUF4388 domain-containing protein, partial [Candidatus Methylomirabilis sp.]|nr:DUF4388 domain-containing protein [Candidatus Methylomirabilis sp.]
MTGWKIVVVDGKSDSRQALRDLLTPLPASVLEAASGAETLSLAKAVRPDLIILRVTASHPDGFEVAAALKQERSTAEIPLILVGAEGGDQTKVRALELGAEDFLPTSVKAEELLARVHQSLRCKRPPLSATPLASGHLQVFPLFALVQILETERRTVRLGLTRGEEDGELIFVDGAIARAVQAGRWGEAAVYQLLTWRDGRFEVVPLDGANPGQREIAVPNQVLLLEAMRRLDEIPGLRAKLPDPAMPLVIPGILRSSLAKDLPSEAWGLASLLDGTRDLNQVLAQSPFDDWMSLKMLVYLSSVRALTSTGGGSERRGSPRIELQVPMDYMRVPRCEKANTLNLSAQGVYLQTAASLDEGEEVFLWLPIPGEATSTPIRGRVVWRTPDAS